MLLTCTLDTSLSYIFMSASYNIYTTFLASKFKKALQLIKREMC